MEGQSAMDEKVVKKAYMFPGQGSQKVGMGLEVFRASRAARDVFDEADEALGFHFSKLIFNGSAEDLRDTVNSQPAIMTTSIACWEAYKELHGLTITMPFGDIAAGHSLGEYTSLVASNSLGLSDALKLVRRRGELMRDVSGNRPGAMIAIFGLDELAIVEICGESGVELANDNSDDQVVLSGDTSAIAQAVNLAHARGAKKVVSLEVSGAFHSSLMFGAVDGLTEAISKANIKDAEIPIVANSNAEVIVEAQEIREELISGLCRCVRWKDSVRYMLKSGVSCFIEIGPGKVLSSLIRRIDRNVKVTSASDMASIKEAAKIGE